MLCIEFSFVDKLVFEEMSKVRKMRKENVIECLRRVNVNYEKKLEEFISTYDSYVLTIKEMMVQFSEGSEDLFIANEFMSWLNEQGYSLFYNAIADLDVEQDYKINGFIDYYSFLLSSSQANFSKLVDQLFSIPSQFSKEFLKKKESLVYEQWNIFDGFEKSHEMRYEFSTIGTLEKVPCFI